MGVLVLCYGHVERPQRAHCCAQVDVCAGTCPSRARRGGRCDFRIPSLPWLQATRAQKSLAPLLPSLLPVICLGMHDPASDVVKASIDAMQAAFPPANIPSVLSLFAAEVVTELAAWAAAAAADLITSTFPML